MSDSIEATSEFAVSRDAGPAVVPATGAPAWPLPATADMVRLVQGLYAMFWGLMAAVFGTTQMVLPLSRPLAGWVMVIGGTMGVVSGAWRLKQTRLYPVALDLPNESWKKRTSALAWLSILLLYFAVIFVMWHDARPNRYLFGNVIAYFLVFAAFLVALNFVVPPLAQVLSRQQLALEAQVFAATNIGLIMLPLIGTIGYVTAVALSQWPKSTPDPLTVVQDLMATLMFRLNLVVLAAVLLPFSLTLALLWAAKDSALRALTNPVAPKEPGNRS